MSSLRSFAAQSVACSLSRGPRLLVTSRTVISVYQVILIEANGAVDVWAASYDRKLFAWSRLPLTHRAAAITRSLVQTPAHQALTLIYL